MYTTSFHPTTFADIIFLPDTLYTDVAATRATIMIAITQVLTAWTWNNTIITTVFPAQGTRDLTALCYLISAFSRTWSSGKMEEAHFNYFI